MDEVVKTHFPEHSRKHLLIRYYHFLGARTGYIRIFSGKYSESCAVIAVDIREHIIQLDIEDNKD